MARGAGLAAALAPACTAKPAGFPLGWGAAFPLALGAATDTKTASSATVGDRGRFGCVGLPVNCTMASLPLSVTTGFGFKKASNVDCKLRFRGTFAAIVGCVGCAGVWGCGDMGVTSGDSGDLGDSTATTSSLDS